MSSNQKTMEKIDHPCVGNMVITPGIGAIAGQFGEGPPHRHWTHQLSVSMDGQVAVSAGNVLLLGKALFIKANTPHQMVAGKALSIYLDPATAVSRALCRKLACREMVCVVPPPMTEFLAECFADTLSLSDSVGHLKAQLGVQEVGTDDRLDLILAALHRDVRDRGTVGAGRAELARLAGLSQGRFSHWFTEQTGMPFRSYRKWLLLNHGFEQAIGHRHLAGAAGEFRFSGDVYFSLAFVSTFGVRPIDVLAL